MIAMSWKNWKDPKASHLEDADCFIQQLDELKIIVC